MPKLDLKMVFQAVQASLNEADIRSDKAGGFAFDNHQTLRDHKVFSALVPSEFGGGGCSHRDMAAFLREVASVNASTALALAMHQHLIAAAVYNDRNGKPGRNLLDKVVANEMILVSTGANDWMQSNGTATRTNGGFTVTALKPFASGSPAAHAVVTSVQYDDPEKGAQVLHFSLPMQSGGLSLLDDWDTMGMRESGSQTLSFQNVFIPEAAIILSRPRDGYIAIFDVVLPCALPLIMSVYLGIAEESVKTALEHAAKKEHNEITAYIVGEMMNQLTTAQVIVADMLAISNDLDFTASLETTNAILTRKTIAVKASIGAVKKAMEVVGGAGYFRKMKIERMLRDIEAAQFHPMQEKPQHRFSGRVALGMDPIG